MKVTQLNSTQLETVSKSFSMSSYLRKLEEGRPATPRSWLYEGQDANVVLTRWIEIMHKSNASSPYGDLFNQFDEKQISKFGPQGKVPPVSEALEVYEESFSSSEYSNPEALSKWFPYTEQFAKELFGPRLRTKRRLSIDKVIDDMQTRDTLTTNSGYPRFARREKVRTEEIQDALSGKAYEYPAITLFRHYNGKLRGVWMFPMSMNLLEAQFTQVIQECLRMSPTTWVRDYLSPWEGFEQVKAILTKQWAEGTRMFGGDTTAMDAHFRLAQTRLVYECVKWLFQESEWSSLWKNMEHVNTIELLVGPNSKTVGDHGVSSGSGWTQLVETILQMFMAWILHLIGQGIGDDFSWLNKDRKEAQYFVDFMAQFGLPAKPEKQSDEEDWFTFLQRMFRRGFFSRDNPQVLGAYYPTIRALNSSLNPEKFHKPALWSVDMFCARQYMILENTVDDPCFPEFVQLIVKGHPELIPFAQKSADELDTIQQQARLIPGLNPSYNQEKLKRPLSSFSSIQLARTLA